MDLKQLFQDDDAVSPVIGVILMVAITVILAAVIASFVLNLGGQVDNTTPQASWTFEYSDGGTGGDELTMTHDGGDSIDEARLNISSDTDFRQGTGNSSTSAQTSDIGLSATSSTGPWGQSDDEFSSGDQIGITADDGGSLDSATVRIVYTEEGGSSSSTLATFEGPDA